MYEEDTLSSKNPLIDWYHQWVLDVLVCNWLGLYLGKLGCIKHMNLGTNLTKLIPRDEGVPDVRGQGQYPSVSGWRRLIRYGVSAL